MTIDTQLAWALLTPTITMLVIVGLGLAVIAWLGVRNYEA